MYFKDKRILIIDDEEQIRSSIKDYLDDLDCCTQTAKDGREGLEIFFRESFDAVLVDLNMPNVDGFKVIEEITARTTNIPIIVISGIGIIDRALEAVRKGAWDFLTKPLHSFDVLHHTMSRAFERSMLIATNEKYKNHLEDEVRRKTDEILSLSREMIRTQKEIILTLGQVVETRSKETANHVRRVAELSYLLAVKIGIADDEASQIKIAAPMHDVGKIGIPDTILNKAGSLTPEEFDIIKGHCQLGYDIFSQSQLPVLQLSAQIALSHHERWDGSGYPNGLKGEAISIGGRITCIVDVFDALSHDRVYKKAWPREEVLKFMDDNRGKMFDPNLLDVFKEHLGEFLHISEIYKD